MTVYKAELALNTQQLKTRSLYQLGIRPMPALESTSVDVRSQASFDMLNNTLNSPRNSGFSLA